MKRKSKQPRKQRKFLYTAPLHIRRKLMAASLSKPLLEKYKVKSLPVRKGDEVEVMRGKHFKKTGKVSKIDLKNYRVYIEGITIKRTDGTEKQVPMHPSKLRIINLVLNDEKRKKILERKMEVKHGKIEKATSSEVLEIAKKSKKVGSSSKTRAAQKV